MAVLDTQEAQLRADAKAKKALLDLAKINLGYTRIAAPVSGMVSERGVRDGQYVHAGSQVITVVPLDNVWVLANYKETQLTHVAIGQRAEIRVDTFPGIVINAIGRQHRAGERRAVQPAAAGQCDRQFHQGRAADPGQIADRIRQPIGWQVAAGHVRHRDDPHRHDTATACDRPATHGGNADTSFPR